MTAQAAVTEKCQQDSKNVCVGSGSGGSTSTATTYRYLSQRDFVTRARRSTRDSETNMMNRRQAQRLSDGEEKAKVLMQREEKIMHIMAYVTYDAKFQYEILIYNTQNTLH